MTNSENETSFELPGELPKGLEARVRRTIKSRRPPEELPFDELIGQGVELHNLRKANANLQLEAAIWKRKYFELLVGESEEKPLNSRQRKKAAKLLENAQQEEEEALALPDVELPDIDLPEDNSTVQK